MEGGSIGVGLQKHSKEKNDEELPYSVNLL